MYLSRLMVNQTRLAAGWMANPYRVHQRLMMACEKDPRLLFRLEHWLASPLLLVQTHLQPDWDAAFGSFSALAGPVECKEFNPELETGAVYRFRMLANPTVKRDGKRLGLISEFDQRAWLARKLEQAGAELLGCQVSDHGLQHLEKPAASDHPQQTHLAVLFDGALAVREPERLLGVLKNGIGAAKGYGYGLLSLARGG